MANAVGACGKESEKKPLYMAVPIPFLAAGLSSPQRFSFLTLRLLLRFAFFSFLLFRSRRDDFLSPSLSRRES
jgi:hypothetical protein